METNQKCTNHFSARVSKMTLFGFYVFGFLRCVNGLNAADNPQINSVNPPQNYNHASCAAIISATFNENMQVGNANTFSVHGSQTGKLSGIYAGGFSPSLSFDPANNFKPGERIDVTLTTGLLSSESIALPTPYVWQFTATSSGTGEGYFGGDNYPFGTGILYTLGVALGDLNNDNDLDIVMGNSGDNIFILINEGNGNFLNAEIISINNYTNDIALGDVNNDGFLDIVVSNEIINPTIIYLNDGYGNFSEYSSVPSNNHQSVQIIDMNGDGYLDLLIGCGSRQNKLYINDGTGDFGDSVVYFGSEENLTREVVAGDLDNDGDLDIVESNEGQLNYIYLNDGFCNFTLSSSFGSGTDHGYSLALGDVDKDGDLDIAVGCGSQGELEYNVIYINNGNANIINSYAFGRIDEHTNDLIFGDVDKDGDLDIICGNYHHPFGAQNHIYFNDGNGNYNSFSNFGTGSDRTISVALGDIDNDGDLDIVTGNGPVWDNGVTLPDTGWNVVYLNEPFPELNILSPNGGEAWLSGTTQNIVYSASPSISSVSLEYSLDAGTNWNLINAPVQNVGNYAWLIPEVSSTLCLVRVTDASQPFISDISDKAFRILSTPDPTPTATPTDTPTPTHTPTPTSTPTACVTPLCIGGISIAAIANPTTFLGSNALQQMFDSGDLNGQLTYVSVQDFNSMTISELRNIFDVLVFISGETGNYNADWNTRLLPYMNRGGGIFWENVANFSDLSPGVTNQPYPQLEAYEINQDVPILTQCLTTNLKKSYFCFTTWDSILSIYLTGLDQPYYVMGLYGEYPGKGRIVLTASAYNNYFGIRGNADWHGNQYQQLLNGILWVTEIYRKSPNLFLQPTVIQVHRGQDVEIAVNVSEATGVVGYRMALDLDPSKVSYVEGSATKVGTSTEIGWGPLVVSNSSPELALFTCACASETITSGSASLMKFQLRITDSLADFTPISVTFNPLTSLNEDAIAYNAEIWSATVMGPNHQPSFTSGGPVCVAEDCGPQTIGNWAANIVPGPPYESWQLLYFTVAGYNPTLFSATPEIDSSGTLRFTPAPNANGITSATVYLHDTGGTENGGINVSAAHSLIISVTPVNDAPSFIGGATVTIVNAMPPVMSAFPSFATAVTAGPPDEWGQMLSFLVTNNHPEKFTMQPSIPGGVGIQSATMLILPAINAHGVIHAQVGLYDNGGQSLGGINHSATQIFTIRLYKRFRWGDLNANDQAGSVDASLLLQYNAELITTFPGYPQNEYPEYYTPYYSAAFPPAADVNADGIAGTLDASLVLQKYAFLIEYFPADSSHDQFGPDAPLPPGKVSMRDVARRLSASVEGRGSSWIVKFKLDNAQDLSGLRLALLYDPAQVSVDEAAAQWLVPGGMLVTNNLQAGRFIVAGALTAPLGEGPRELLSIKFDRIADSASSIVIRIDEATTQFNDGQIQLSPNSVTAIDLNNPTPIKDWMVY